MVLGVGDAEMERQSPHPWGGRSWRGESCKPMCAFTHFRAKQKTEQGAVMAQSEAGIVL